MPADPEEQTNNKTITKAIHKQKHHQNRVTWVAAIRNAAADVKPTMTGVAMRFTMNPMRNRPRSSWSRHTKRTPRKHIAEKAGRTRRRRRRRRRRRHTHSE